MLTLRSDGTSGSRRNGELNGLATISGCPSATFPATFVPVTPQVGRLTRNAHEMSNPNRDRPVAAGADVLLARFVGLHAAHLDGAIEPVPHRGRLAPHDLALRSAYPPPGRLGGHARKPHTTSAVMIVNALTMTT